MAGVDATQVTPDRQSRTSSSESRGEAGPHTPTPEAEAQPQTSQSKSCGEAWWIIRAV